MWSVQYNLFSLFFFSSGLRGSPEVRSLGSFVPRTIRSPNDSISILHAHTQSSCRAVSRELTEVWGTCDGVVPIPDGPLQGRAQAARPDVLHVNSEHNRTDARTDGGEGASVAV